jgi:superfamily II DNA helicase RecQ
MLEHITTRTFKGFIKRTRSSGRLARIIVNECHYVLFTSLSFRPQLKRLQAIATKETPLTLLSVTVPPCEEQNL